MLDPTLLLWLREKLPALLEPLIDALIERRIKKLPAPKPQTICVGGGGVAQIPAGPASFARGATFVNPAGLSLPVNDVAVTIPVACTIGAVTLLALGGSGSAVIDIWKRPYASYPPTSADSICAAAKPAIGDGIQSADATLAGWTKTVAAGDALIFHLESVSGAFTYLDVTLKLTPT